MMQSDLRFECAQTGIGNGDNVRHKYDGGFGTVLYIYQKTDDDGNDFLLLGRPPRLIEPSQNFARVEFLVAWLFNGHPVVWRYSEGIETFLLEKVHDAI